MINLWSPHNISFRYSQVGLNMATPSLANKGIFDRMNHMWEERKIVLCLAEYHSSADIEHLEKIKAIKEGVERAKFFQFVAQRVFKVSMLSITEETMEIWKKIRYIVDECLEDGYLIEKELKTTPLDKNFEQYLFLTSKGKKLMRKSYFYLKYLPEEFGDFKVVLLAIIGTIITSPLWSPIFHYVGALLSQFPLTGN